MEKMSLYVHGMFGFNTHSGVELEWVEFSSESNTILYPECILKTSKICKVIVGKQIFVGESSLARVD